MPIVQLVPLGSGAFESQPITLEDAQGATLTPQGAGGLIYLQTSTGTGWAFGTRIAGGPPQQIIGPVTFRAVRQAGAEAGLVLET